MGRCSFLLWLLISAFLAAAGSSSQGGTGLGRKVLENPDSEVAASFLPDHYLVVDHWGSTGNSRHLVELNDYNGGRTSTQLFPPKARPP